MSQDAPESDAEPAAAEDEDVTGDPWQTWSPTPGRFGKIVAWVVLIAFIAVMVVGVLMMTVG